VIGVERITDAADPRIALFRSVTDPELARTAGLFVAEGRLVVRRVLDDRRYQVRSVLVNEAAYRDLEPLLVGLDSPTFLCDAADFAGVTGINFHRGCLALVERPAPTTIGDLIVGADRIVALDGVGNPDNVGSVFRNVAALGGGVLLGPECCDPFYRKAVRTSMGAVLSVPFACAHDWPDDLRRLRAEGFTIVALTPRSPSETLDAFAARAGGLRLALLVGAEGAGLSSSVAAAADVRVRIPMADVVDSLNLAVAVAIALYRLRRT
jgi:tRNA G18 (ribose-2'-O)-methylase SpoU